MSKLGLALSGGGFRATLYHLGVVKFLKDAGVLADVTNIASVSGGSILAAHLVLNWDKYNGDNESFEQVAQEVIKFVQFDVRNHILRRLPLQLPMRLLAKLPFIDGRRFTPNALLEKYYKKHLFGDRCLHELPDYPMLHILATSVSTGVLSAFNKNGLYIQERDGDEKHYFSHIPGQLASIPRVVGASSAFPGFFPPVQITASDLGIPEGQFPSEYFTDGGVFDNLGLRAFLWLKEQGEEFDHIIVSDAGKPFQILTDAALGLIGQSFRASDILWDRVWQLERENFSRRDEFSFLPVTELVNQQDDPTAIHPVIQTEIQTIRTDLDYFSDEEINALVQHGYEVTRKLCRELNILNENQIPKNPPWKPIDRKEKKNPLSVLSSSKAPSRDTKLARQLQNSSRRKIFFAFFDLRDWPSYLYILIAFIVLIYLPLQVYQLYQKSVTQADVIASIASGDPDVKMVLELATSDPSEDWVSMEVEEATKPAEEKIEGIEVISHSRFYDLRHWDPDDSSSEELGQVYIYDRVTLKFHETYEGDRKISMIFPSQLEDISVREPKSDFKPRVTRTKEPIEEYGKEMTVYQFEYNLEDVLPEEPVTIENEVIAKAHKTNRAPIVLRTKTDLVSVWLLFPSHRPYKSYSLVSYPADRSAPAKIMQKRYVIDHPYGYLIGWSVVNPDIHRVYECRWTY